MANWQFRFNFKEDSEKWEKKEITSAQLAGAVAGKLELLKHRVSAKYPDEIDELESIICGFRGMAADPESDVEEFDSNLEALYDWGDTALDNTWGGKKLCWIEH